MYLTQAARLNRVDVTHKVIIRISFGLVVIKALGIQSFTISNSHHLSQLHRHEILCVRVAKKKKSEL